MPAQAHRTAFLRCRRNNYHTARLVRRYLNRHDVDVFFENQKFTEAYDEAFLHAQMATRAHYIFIATPGALRRAQTHPDDWLKQELLAAHHANRSLILLAFANVDMQAVYSCLTGDLRPLRDAPLITLDLDDLSTSLANLKSALLKPVDVTLKRLPCMYHAEAKKREAFNEAQPYPTRDEVAAEFLLEQAFVVYDSADWPQAETLFSGVIATDPDSGVAYHLRGAIRAARQKYTDAEADFTSAIRLQPNHADPVCSRAQNRLFGLQDLDGALDDFNRALQIFPGYWEALTGRAAANLYRGDFTAAHKDAQNALDLNPEHSEARYYRGLARHYLGNLDDALDDYIAAGPGLGDYVDLYRNRGLLRLQREEYARALTDLDYTIELDTADADARMYRGMARHGLGRLDEALADYRSLWEDDARAAAALNNSGEVALEQERFEQARELFTRAQAQHSDWDAPAAGLALALFALDRRDEAAQSWTDLINKDDRHRHLNWLRSSYNWRPPLIDLARQLTEALDH